MKTGPFGEHSPILNDISGVATWEKVNSGTNSIPVQVGDEG